MLPRPCVTALVQVDVPFVLASVWLNPFCAVSQQKNGSALGKSSIQKSSVFNEKRF